MIKFEHINVCGWEAAIRGMRNPMNSWDKSDSNFKCGANVIGENDLDLMHRLASAGPDHRKFLRMIHVTMDIVAPLYWWKEFDTYKIGTVRNSCSTMHKITAKEFELDDFSFEHWVGYERDLTRVINTLNTLRNDYIKSKDKNVWYSIIQFLPSGYNQRATIDLNYEVLRNIRNSDRKSHKQDEWREDFIKMIDGLPYAKELLIKDKIV